MDVFAKWVVAHAWVFMVVPAVSYALWALALKETGKPLTGAAWTCYVAANLFFLLAHWRGE